MFQSTTIPSNSNSKGNQFDFFATTTPANNFDPFAFDFSEQKAQKNLDLKERKPQPTKLEQSNNGFNFQSQFATHSGVQNDFFSQTANTQSNDGFGWDFSQNNSKQTPAPAADSWGFGDQTSNGFQFGVAKENKDQAFNFNAKYKEPSSKSNPVLDFNSGINYAHQQDSDQQEEKKSNFEQVKQQTLKTQTQEQCPGIQDEEIIQQQTDNKCNNLESHHSTNSIHLTLQTKTLQGKQQEFLNSTTNEQQKLQQNSNDNEEQNWRNKFFQKSQPTPSFKFQQYATQNAMQTFGVKKQQLPSFNQPQQSNKQKQSLRNFNNDDAFSFQPNQSQQQFNKQQSQLQQQEIEIIDQDNLNYSSSKKNKNIEQKKSIVNEFIQSPAKIGSNKKIDYNFWFGSNQFDRASEVDDNGLNNQSFGRLSKDDWNLSRKNTLVRCRFL